METITVREAAEMLGYTREMIYYLIRKGKLHAVKPGRDWQVDKESVEVYKAMREAQNEKT